MVEFWALICNFVRFLFCFISIVAVTGPMLGSGAGACNHVPGSYIKYLPIYSPEKYLIEHNEKYAQTLYIGKYFIYDPGTWLQAPAPLPSIGPVTATLFSINDKHNLLSSYE